MARRIHNGKFNRPEGTHLPRPPGPGSRLLRKLRGFTFIEMMVVMAIIAVLISMAIPIYQKSIIRAKESVLSNNLFTLRTVIDNYTYDKEKAPQTLQDLVSEGYLRQVPADPMTGSSQDWRVIMEDPGSAVNQDNPGIFDIRSGSDKIGLNGVPYSDW
jgi:general secretion pathway protein G